HPRSRGDVSAGGEPIPVALEFDAELLVIDPEIAIASARDRLGPCRLHFLRDDADIGLVAAEIAEAVIAEAALEMTEQDDIVLQRDVGTPAAASAAAESSATAATPEAAAAA